jgi:hypothetical protein
MDYDSTQQIISWFADNARAGKLALAKPYQRRPVWSLKQKCYLIESVLMRLPIPEVFLHIVTDEEGESAYAVVDGQQRMRAVLDFVGLDVKDESPAEDFRHFTLDQLDATSPWKNMGFRDLSPEEKRQFYRYSIGVRELSNATDGEVRQMFTRLNRYLTKLNDQELRNATYSGPFLELANKLADDDYWLDSRIVTRELVRRMKDVEFMSELIIGVMHGPQGGKAKEVDEYYALYDVYEDEFPEEQDAKRLFSRTLSAIKQVLPEIKDSRWHNRTDFYTLFVAFAHLLRIDRLLPNAFRNLRHALLDFANEVELRLADEVAEVRPHAIRYVDAVKRGTSDKARRAVRHKALLEVISPHFKSSTR